MEFGYEDLDERRLACQAHENITELVCSDHLRFLCPWGKTNISVRIVLLQDPLGFLAECGRQCTGTT